MQNKHLYVRIAALAGLSLMVFGCSNSNNLQLQPRAIIQQAPTTTQPIPTADLTCGDEPLAPAAPSFGRVLTDNDYFLWSNDVLTWGRTCHDTLARVRGMNPLVGVVTK